MILKLDFYLVLVISTGFIQECCAHKKNSRPQFKHINEEDDFQLKHASSTSLFMKLDLQPAGDDDSQLYLKLPLVSCDGSGCPNGNFIGETIVFKEEDSHRHQHSSMSKHKDSKKRSGDGMRENTSEEIAKNEEKFIKYNKTLQSFIKFIHPLIDKKLFSYNIVNKCGSTNSTAYQKHRNNNKHEPEDISNEGINSSGSGENDSERKEDDANEEIKPIIEDDKTSFEDLFKSCNATHSNSSSPASENDDYEYDEYDDDPALECNRYNLSSTTTASETSTEVTTESITGTTEEEVTDTNCCNRIEDTQEMINKIRLLGLSFLDMGHSLLSAASPHPIKPTTESNYHPLDISQENIR